MKYIELVFAIIGVIAVLYLLLALGFTLAVRWLFSWF